MTYAATRAASAAPGAIGYSIARSGGQTVRITGDGVFGDPVIIRVVFDPAKSRYDLVPVSAGVEVTAPDGQTCVTASPVNNATPCRSSRGPRQWH